MVKELGEDDVLLVRAHYLVAERVSGRMAIPHPALDVSRFPDMAELLAAADVLVTDYSSAMFDFACTGRPIVFYAHDLARYRDEVRGLYFDLEREAPGPVVRTEDELIHALQSLDGDAYEDGAYEKAHAASYQDFAAKFCPWDDGRASARVVERMLD
jgi:CDP-glycerol glycerophosphotransferase